MSDTLLHRWTQPDPVGDPTWWACSCLIEHRGAPPDLLCPDRVAQLQADLAAEREAHAALRGRIEGLLDGWADTLTMADLLDADSDTTDFDTLAECREQLLSLLTPDPEPGPSTDGGS